MIRDANATSLPQLLREYTDYGALAVNWQVTTPPAGNMLLTHHIVCSSKCCMTAVHSIWLELPNSPSCQMQPAHVLPKTEQVQVDLGSCCCELATDGREVMAQIFGASGHVTTPQGSTLSSYTACYPEHDLENQHVKSIVNMDFVYQIGRDPHHFNVLCKHLHSPLGKAAYWWISRCTSSQLSVAVTIAPTVG